MRFLHEGVKILNPTRSSSYSLSYMLECSKDEMVYLVLAFDHYNLVRI